MKTRFLFLSLTVFTFIALLGSCTSNEIRNSDNPEEIYNEAVRLLEDDSFLEASDYLNELRRRFPQSRFAILAELRSADLDFAQDAFIEAAAGYSVFVDLYPKHPEAPYAQFRKTLSFFNSAPDNIARDQSSAADAVKSSQAFLKRYGNSPYKKDVVEILEQSRLKLAQKEAYVARFYRKREAYEAAIKRWELLMANYKDIGSSEEGQALLEEAQQSANSLRQEISEDS